MGAREREWRNSGVRAERSDLRRALGRTKAEARVRESASLGCCDRREELAQRTGCVVGRYYLVSGIILTGRGCLRFVRCWPRIFRRLGVADVPELRGLFSG